MVFHMHYLDAKLSSGFLAVLSADVDALCTVDLNETYMDQDITVTNVRGAPLRKFDVPIRHGDSIRCCLMYMLRVHASFATLDGLHARLECLTRNNEPLPRCCDACPRVLDMTLPTNTFTACESCARNTLCGVCTKRRLLLDDTTCKYYVPCVMCGHVSWRLQRAHFTYWVLIVHKDKPGCVPLRMDDTLDDLLQVWFNWSKPPRSLRAMLMSDAGKFVLYPSTRFDALDPPVQHMSKIIIET